MGSKVPLGNTHTRVKRPFAAIVNTNQPSIQLDPFQTFFLMLEGIDKTDTISEHDTLRDLMAGERAWWVGL